MEHFFSIGAEILIIPGQVLSILRGMPAAGAAAIGRAIRKRVLREHAAAHRAAELECYLQEATAAGSLKPFCFF